MKVFTQFDDDLRTIWTAAFEADRDQWPFFTFAWHEAWHTHLASEMQLMIFSDDEKKVLLPLAISADTAHFTGGEEIADYLDMVGNKENKQSLWQETLAWLATHKITNLSLRNIPESSESLAFFRDLGTALVEEEDSTPILRLPESFEAYVSSLDRKRRHEMRRKLRKFYELYPQTTFEVLAHPDIDLLIRLMRRNSEKHTFLTPSMEKFFRDLPSSCATRLKQFVLARNNQPIATTLAFTSGQSLLLYNSGYDPAIEGAGWYLKSKLIGWALEHTYSEVNFLQGKERYKYDLGASDAFVYRVTLAL